MSKKHILLMAACCLIPIAAIIAIGALAIPVSSITPIAIALICPLMMLLMMRSMHGDHEEHHDHISRPIEKSQPAVMTSGELPNSIRVDRQRD